MSAFSAAAQDEDGDIIKTLQARVADLEAQLYAVGAGGVGSTVARQGHPEQHLEMVPAGWKLVPVEPTIPMLHRADGLTCIDFVALGEEGAFDLDELKEIYRAMLAAAPQLPVVEQQSDSDMVSVPRSLLGAACAGMRHRLQDAPKVLEQLRRYTVGDLSKSAVEQPQSVTYCHQSQPQVAPPGSTESAYQRGYLDGMSKGRRDAESDAAEQQTKREPLTDDAATRLVQSVVAGSDRPIGMVAFGLLVARSTERAHGIGGAA